MAAVMIQSIHFYHFEQPLAHPFFVRNNAEVQSREGLIVHVISDKGAMGFGEISPLPGISPETFKKAAYQADAMARELKGLWAPLEPHILVKWLSERLPDTHVCSSVKFGLESAIMSMVTGILSQTIKTFLRPGKIKDIRSAGLLQGTAPDVARQARFLLSKGYTTFKLKVGNRNIPLDVKKVDAVRGVIGPEGRLRLDADRAWRLDEALVFAQNIGKDRIDYIEEPLADPVQLAEFFRLTDIPIAVNETWTDQASENSKTLSGSSYAVVRPMSMGGITGFLRSLEKAEQLGMPVVVTSAFETGVGMTILANLAAIAAPSVADLGTANWFDEDLLLRPVIVGGGIIPEDRLSFGLKFFHRSFASQLKAT
jgi:o-succinylbenzoate synthase